MIFNYPLVYAYAATLRGTGSGVSWGALMVPDCRHMVHTGCASAARLLSKKPSSKKLQSGKRKRRAIDHSQVVVTELIIGVS